MLSMQQMESLLPSQSLGAARVGIDTGGGGMTTTIKPKAPVKPVSRGVPITTRQPSQTTVVVPVSPTKQPGGSITVKNPFDATPIIAPRMPAANNTGVAPPKLIKLTPPSQSPPIINPTRLPASDTNANSVSTTTTPAAPLLIKTAPATAPIIVATSLPSVSPAAPSSSSHSMSTTTTKPAIETLLPEPSLVEEPKPWYKNPYVWLGIGGAAAAVGGGAWYLTSRKGGGLNGTRRRRRVR